MDTVDDDADQQQEEGRLAPDNNESERLEALSHITAHNTLLQKRVGTGSARAKGGTLELCTPSVPGLTLTTCQLCRIMQILG
jgi:hypothetical protein